MLRGKRRGPSRLRSLVEWRREGEVAAREKGNISAQDKARKAGEKRGQRGTEAFLFEGWRKIREAGLAL